MRVLPLMTLALFAPSGATLGQEPALEDMETACANLDKGFCAEMEAMPDLKLCAVTTRRNRMVLPLRAAKHHILVSRHGEELTTHIMTGVPSIGMPEWALICSWGQPTRVNVSADASGEKKEYVYAPAVNAVAAGLQNWAVGTTAATLERQRMIDDATRRVEIRDGKVTAYHAPVVQ